MDYNSRRLVIELSEGGGVLVPRSRVVPSYVYRVTVKILYTTTLRQDLYQPASPHNAVIILQPKRLLVKKLCNIHLKINACNKTCICAFCCVSFASNSLNCLFLWRPHSAKLRNIRRSTLLYRRRGQTSNGGLGHRHCFACFKVLSRCHHHPTLASPQQTLCLFHLLVRMRFLLQIIQSELCEIHSCCYLHCNLCVNGISRPVEWIDLILEKNIEHKTLRFAVLSSVTLILARPATLTLKFSQAICLRLFGSRL